jgi:hypothetical protein
MKDLVALAVSQGGLGNDALLAAVLPLFHATADVHERGLVAPLRGLDRITVDEQTRLGFAPEHASRPITAPREIQAREGHRAEAVEVVAHRQADIDLGESGGQLRTQVPEPTPEAIHAPALVPGWQSWEHVVGHHDPLTDIFSLGQLLIGLGCGLDLDRSEDVAELIDARGNFYLLKTNLHPVILSVASQMAEPDRHHRAQDLRSLIEQLENYRDQPLDFDVDAITRDTADRRAAVLKALRDRLFDLSRRNRLVNFRHTAQTLNLTEVSVPLMLDVRNIRAEQLFTWNQELAARLTSGTAQTLGKWIRYDEAPYAASSLDKLISTARRDRAEYGQDQLRLVPAFLRWHDLKNDPGTRLASPLVLVKVELAKKRGVRDSYTLRVTDPVAEVNPTLRHHLHQLYGINLPERVDLSEPAALAVLHERLAKEIQASEPGLQLHLREKPRIDLVRQRAMLKLRNYRRRQHGNTANEFGGRHYSYSYRRSDYQPLGVQIFRNQLAVQELPLSIALGADPSVRRPGVIETDTYSIETDGSPYSWDVDLCAVALANFNYRTLGLVRDYDELLDTGRSCQSFDQLFSDRPRPISSEPPELPTAARHLVVPADGSQVAAVARAQRGESFVIQGPPGTGKSQTITNMIADFVARGQRVLFVCQKRAALDVVHARLASRHLDGLCTLIHDSQADKKAFVHGLRETYESWLSAEDDLDPLTVRRDALLARVDRLLAAVGEFESLLGQGDSPSLREVVNQLAELRDHRWGAELGPAERRLVPSPGDWWSARSAVTGLGQALVAADPVGGGVLARSPLALVAPEIWSLPGADAEIPARAAEIRDHWTAVATALEAAGTRASGDPAAPGARVDGSAAGSSAEGRVPAGGLGIGSASTGRSLAWVRAVGELGVVLRPLAERGLGAAIDPGSASAQRLQAAVSQHDSLVAAERAAWDAAAEWKEPLAPADARSALAVAQSKEGGLFSFLSGDWRKVKGLVHSRFDSSGRAVQPSVTDLLKDLVAAHDATAAVKQNEEEASRDWGTSDPSELARRIHQLSQDPALAEWRTALNADPALAARLAHVAAAFEEADDATRGFLTGNYADGTLVAVQEIAEALSSARIVPAIQALVPAMRQLASAPAPVQAAVRRLEATPAQLEYAVCALHWERTRATAAQLTSAQLDDVVGELSLVYDELTTVNSEVVVAGVRRRFLTELAHSELSVSGMSPDDRDRKKTFSTGRRELEHEFGKVMRYRSIRDLASGAPGSVVSLLRPVWLMSPSSVSDTLPLDTAFDVVIYDEASQIPIEEAIPALHRAPQVIVVGDQMQLPPTQYFRVATPTADADDDEAAEQVGIALTDDSFLAISALRLASTMLTWHYRSRSEALISFSNAAFYQGKLATIPDRLPAHTAPPWTVRAADRPLTAEPPAATDHAAPTFPADAVQAGSIDSGGVVWSSSTGVAPGDATIPGGLASGGSTGIAAVADGVLAGSITSVRVVDGVYVRRTNPAEAAWIAGLVRELLGRETGKSLGIVAFSEAQQGEIERALDQLAEADPEFGARYEAEQVRTRDEQDAGLFVKNLENVQGDERDIVIMSVCYAAGPDGRMLMNFGPINTAGGEKRLNVIFSRARQHMVIVSSIEPDAITNTYNDGANTLRRFLSYADAVSRGDVEAAQAALTPYALGRHRLPKSVATSAVISQLAEALRARGLEVDTAVGESVFRCDLALSRPGDPGHRLAVLVDTPTRLASDTLLERLTTHPRALATGGWQVHHVLTTDWTQSPTTVLTRLEDALNRPTDT